jgi:glutathione S-transferase
MTLILFGAPLSPYARACRIAFAEKGVPYEFNQIGPADLHEPDYGKRHPFRKLPSLDVDGTALYETSAIMRFVDEAHDTGVALQPADPLARARYEQWLSAADAYLYDTLFFGLFFQRAVAPSFGMEIDEELIAASIEKTKGYLPVIAAGLQSGELGAPETPQLGDILVAAIILPLMDIDEGASILREHDGVLGWVSKLRERDSFKSTEA